MDARENKRALTNLLLTTGALASGLIAQGYFARSLTPTDGLLAYAVAVSLFGIAVFRTPPLSGLPLRSIVPRWPNRAPAELDIPRSAWPAALLVLAGVAMVLSLAFFGNDVRPSLRWILYLSAILLFVVAAYGLSPTWTGRPVRPGRPSGPAGQAGTSREVHFTGWNLSLLLVILLIGALLRLYRFAELPYGVWYDEADNGLWAREILSRPSFRPIYVPSTNLAAHFLYLVTLAFRLLGDSVYAIRAVAVVFGMLTIVAAYFCGRELGGPYFALALAFLLAVSRWDVNWSRIGMHGVTVPFFELWVVAALLRGLRTGRLVGFAWSGVALGLGLCFYSAMWVFPIVIIGFLLAWSFKWLRRTWRPNSRCCQATSTSPVRMARGRDTRWMTWAVPALFFILGTLMAVGPLAQFSIRQPEVFWDRVKGVSLFKTPRVQGRPVEAIIENVVKHLLMFNYRGDSNGRHNLPRAPMLDRLGGVLFVLGVVMCVVRWREPRSVLLLLWLLIPLSGGILSTWFEAPQSLRSIGSLPAAYALIGLPMEWFAAEWTRVFPKSFSGQRLIAVAVVVLLAIGVENAVTYFHFWARDFASWAAFNAAETRLAQDINLYRDRYDLRFDPLLTAHLTTQYLAPDYEVYHHFDPATVFPIRGADREGTVLFIAPDTYPVRDQARMLYPFVRTETFGHSYSGLVVLHKYFFDQEDIAATQGLDILYMSLGGDGGGTQGVWHPRGVDAEIDFTWDNDPPLAYPFGATWTGGLLAPEYGTYTLLVDAPGEFVLELDGLVVLSGPGSQERQIVMAQGVHTLHLDSRVIGPGPVRLMWRTPDNVTLRPVPHDALYRSSWPVRGLLGRFYPNADWSGEPEIVRMDRQVGYYFHFLPLSRPYTVEWNGRLAVPISGVYRLGLKVVGSASLYLDGQPVLENVLTGRFEETEMALDAGMHDIRVRYLDNQDHAQIYLYWQGPQAGRELIPFDALFLPLDGAWWPAS